MRRRIQGLLPRLGCGGLSLLLMLVVIELALRLFIFGTIHVHRPERYRQFDPVLGWHLEPNASAVVQDPDYTQPDQMGIAGCSYGGYFVAQSIVQYPDLYAAANVQCAVLDLIAWWPQNMFLVTFMEGATPEDQREEYERDSPVFRAAEIRTPLLLFHGMEDRLPISIVEDFRNGIDQAQIPVEMFAFQNEGHSLAYPASRLYAAQLQVAFFREHLSQ